MIRHFSRVRVTLTATLFAIFFTFSSAFAIPVLSISPTSMDVLPGDAFSLNVEISDVIDLYAFQFDLTFDPALLAATAVAEGPFLLNGGSTFFIPGVIDNLGGSIVSTADTLLGSVPGVTGSGTLATFSFDALVPGTSPIFLANVFLLDSSLNPIDFSVSDGSVNIVDVNVVPEPATWLLLGSGIGGFAFVRRRLRR